jgi:translocation and assembly module TamB
VAIRTAQGGALRYEVRAFSVAAGTSRVSGAFAVTPGRRTEVRGLNLTFAPLDLALLRATLGDTILKPAWRGALDGRLVGRGGYLDSLVIDSVRVRYTDARVGGAQSRLSATGVINAAGLTMRLNAFRLSLDSVDVRTLGAAVRAADSLRGTVVGGLVLHGPTDNIEFHSMRLRHIDGDLAPSVVSGSGRLASDPRTRWLDAMLSLDTVTIATLAHGGTETALRGAVWGTLALSAVGDTMTLDARLRAGDGSVAVAGTTLLDSLRTRLALTGRMAALDPRLFTVRRDVPAMSLTGALHATVSGDVNRPDMHLEVTLDTASRVGDSRIAGGVVRVGRDSSGLHVDTAHVRADTWFVEARGSLAAAGESNDSLAFAVAFDSLGALGALLLDSTGAPRFATLEGRLRSDSGVARGSFERLAVGARVGVAHLRVGDVTVRSAVGSLDLTGLPDRGAGRLRGTLDTTRVAGYLLDRASVEAVVDSGTHARVTATVTSGDTVSAAALARVRWPDHGYRIALDSLAARVGAHRWRLAAPAEITVRGGDFAVDSAVFRSNHGGEVMVSGAVPDRGEINAHLALRRMSFAELAIAGVLPGDLSGEVSGTARLSGMRDAPAIALEARVDSIRSEEQQHPQLQIEANYANQAAKLAVNALLGDRRVLELAGEVPVNLSLRAVDDRVIDGPMRLRLRTDSLALADFEGLAPRVSSLEGTVTADLDIGGTVRRPRGTGIVTLEGGSFDVLRYGIAARRGVARLELAGDSVVVRRLRLTDSDSPDDTASATGVVRVAGRRWSDWSVALRSVASGFRVIDDPRLATVEADWSLDVTGALGAPRVTGRVRLPLGVFTIGPTRRPTSDTAEVAGLGMPNTDGVIVSLGSDVRLKSRDANVQLAGDLELFGPLNRPWISGSVQATRGTYRVDLGLIKRTFRVDSGAVVLEGTPEVPAALDIYTSYTVRRPDDDVTVRAHLYGTTERPRLDLSSDLGSAVPQSEIISYLVFGKPSFALQESAQSPARTATAALVPSLGGVLEGVLGTVLPFFSTLQVTSTVGNENPGDLLANPVESLLNSYAITGGRQVGTDSFLSISAGRCGASRVSSTGNVPYWLGAAAEYRPKRSVGVLLSVDPGPAPCRRVGAVGDTYQLGLDLTYDWRFLRK